MSGLARKSTYLYYLARNELDNWFAAPYRSLLVNSDESGWVLDNEARELLAVCRELGVKARMGHVAGRKNACIHYTSQYVLDDPGRFLSDKGSRYSLSYFHGGPGDIGFGDVFAALCACRDRLWKVHVSNTAVERACLNAGFAPGRIARIPIGVNIGWFDRQTPVSRAAARETLGIDADAFVIGSFQKDGQGWGEGLEPKLIKGPDVLVETLRNVKPHISNLTVLLSGPSRGYVIRELKKSGIEHVHVFYKNPQDVARLYHALDGYLVTSRVEGGPKAILESMASGVPLVTTKVGQAVDLVTHGVNGWMVDSGDVEGLAEGVMTVFEDRPYFERMKDTARSVAEAEDYAAQTGRWAELFLRGFVEGV